MTQPSPSDLDITPRPEHASWENYNGRRASVRQAPDAATSCDVPFASGLGSALPALIRDISEGGIGLTTARWFGPGTILVVELENSKRAFRRSLPAMVVHAVWAPGQGWHIGCAWCEKLDPADLNALA